MMCYRSKECAFHNVGSFSSLPFWDKWIALLSFQACIHLRIYFASMESKCSKCHLLYIILKCVSHARSHFNYLKRLRLWVSFVYRDIILLTTVVVYHAVIIVLITNHSILQTLRHNRDIACHFTRAHKLRSNMLTKRIIEMTNCGIL